jgi:hypothetical protein
VGPLAPDAQLDFQTISKSKNHMQNGDAMQKNACGVNGSA